MKKAKVIPIKPRIDKLKLREMAEELVVLSKFSKDSFAQDLLNSIKTGNPMPMPLSLGERIRLGDFK